MKTLTVVAVLADEQAYMLTHKTAFPLPSTDKPRSTVVIPSSVPKVPAPYKENWAFYCKLLASKT